MAALEARPGPKGCARKLKIDASTAYGDKTAP
jgi:hypothetical protein